MHAVEVSKCELARTSGLKRYRLIVPRGRCDRDPIGKAGDLFCTSVCREMRKYGSIHSPALLCSGEVIPLLGLGVNLGTLVAARTGEERCSRMAKGGPEGVASRCLLILNLDAGRCVRPARTLGLYLYDFANRSKLANEYAVGFAVNGRYVVVCAAASASVQNGVHRPLLSAGITKGSFSANGKRSFELAVCEYC